ncbi:glycosyltransferase [Pseudonocardiaceae bacterium YIM PH 21723]|nr:glycosyltransferase [Pseudonocardiaceae bacterium YIM PH 21723]
MRLLFASLATPGHTYPLLPLAVAAQRAGHEVHFASGPGMHAELDRLGLRPFQPGQAVYQVFAGDIRTEMARLRPDRVIAGWGVPGVIEAAVELDIPRLWHGFGRMFPDGIGLEPLSFEDPHIDICPPLLQDPAFVSAATRIPLRPLPWSTGGATATRGERPLVFVTFGTSFHVAPALVDVLEGLALLRADVVAAAQTLDAVPDGVTVHPWVDQRELLRQADLVVHHGGSGTTLGALAAGTPQLVIPQGADQFGNADAVVHCGAGRRLDAVSVAAVAAAANAVLRDPACRAAAEFVAAEIAAMPAPGEVARELFASV